MTARKPLATGDDGSGNRYPDRTPVWDGYPPELTVEEARAINAPRIIGWHGYKSGQIVATFGSEAYANAALAARTVDSISPVPASLSAPVPERHEPPCNGDES